MTALALLVVVAYAVIAAAEVPGLWGQPRRRGELWVVLALLLIGVTFSVAVTLGWRPVSPWRVVKVVFEPLGTLLFKPKGG